MIIRELTHEDYDNLLLLWKEAGLSARPQGRDSQERIEAELFNDISLFLVAQENNTLVGSVLGTHDGRKGWINRLAVRPGFRNQGIAQKLVKAVEQWLASQGIEIIACLIESGNDTSVNLFRKLNYAEHEVHYMRKPKTSNV